MAGVVGIDVGATKTVAIAMHAGKVLAAKKIPTSGGGFAKIIDAAAWLAKEISRGHAEKIGVCMAGQVEDGTVFLMPNRDLQGKFDVKKYLEKKTGADVRVGNDGQCFALAEWRMGAAIGCRDVLGITIGTGIGGGIISAMDAKNAGAAIRQRKMAAGAFGGGALLHGAHSQAGEIGHMKLFGRGIACPCGGHGCFERYCGGAGIEAQHFAATGIARSAKEIMEAKGTACECLAKNSASVLGIGLASLANIIDPEMIVLGGSLSEAYCRTPLFGIVKKSYQRECLPRLKSMKIVKAKLEHPSAVGAALLFEG
jgi:glucokinase